MTPLAQAVSLALLHFIWQGALVAAMVGVALAMMRRSSAQSRYLLACSALFVLMMLPLFTAWFVYDDTPTHGSPSTVPSWMLARTSPDNASAPIPGDQMGTSRPWTLNGSMLSRLQPLVLPTWAVGVLLYSLRALIGWRNSRRLSRSGSLAAPAWIESVQKLKRAIGLNRHVRLLISSMVDAPCVVGFLRPVILIPTATLAGLTTQQLEAVIAHELAHIFRHDHWVNLWQAMVETVLFYHPAVWWVSSRIRQERELCCDDLAVAVCGDAVCYARALTAIEKLRLAPQSLVLASNGGSLLQRIARITGQESRATPSADTARLAVGVLLAAFLSGTVLWAGMPVAQEMREVAATSSPKQITEKQIIPAASQPTVVRKSSQTKAAPKSQVLPVQRASSIESNLVTTARVLMRPAVSDTATGEELELIYEGMLKEMDYEDAAAFVRSYSDPSRPARAFKQEIARAKALHQAIWDAPNSRERLTAEAALKDALQADAGKLAIIRDLQLEVELAQHPGQMRGRKIRLVAIVDVPELRQAELRSKLPVSAGQTLTDEAINQTFHVLRDFDPNLRLLLIRGESRDVDFIISAKPVELAIN